MAQEGRAKVEGETEESALPLFGLNFPRTVDYHTSMIKLESLGYCSTQEREKLIERILTVSGGWEGGGEGEMLVRIAGEG